MFQEELWSTELPRAARTRLSSAVNSRHFFFPQPLLPLPNQYDSTTLLVGAARTAVPVAPLHYRYRHRWLLLRIVIGTSFSTK
jgi:hypothetical protein